MRLLIVLTSLLLAASAQAQLLVTDLAGPATLAGGGRTPISRAAINPHSYNKHMGIASSN
jgi:hypothetical protein